MSRIAYYIYTEEDKPTVNVICQKDPHFCLMNRIKGFREVYEKLKNMFIITVKNKPRISLGKLIKQKGKSYFEVIIATFFFGGGGGGVVVTFGTYGRQNCIQEIHVFRKLRFKNKF